MTKILPKEMKADKLVSRVVNNSHPAFRGSSIQLSLTLEEVIMKEHLFLILGNLEKAKAEIDIASKQVQKGNDAMDNWLYTRRLKAISSELSRMMARIPN